VPPPVLPVERCAACAAPAWRLAFARLRDAHEAYDAVQQAFLVAARKPGAVPAGDPWPWFRAVVAHEAKNLRRKKRPAPVGVGGEDDTREGTPMNVLDPRATEPAHAAAQSEGVRRLWAALDALPAVEREAVVLTSLGGLSHAAAAEALGVVRQTVTERARRGLEAVAARLRRGDDATAHALATLPVAGPPRGLADATSSWMAEAVHESTATSGATGLVVQGGTVVATSKAAWMVGVAVATALGFAGGAVTDGFGVFGAAAPEAGARSVAAPAVVDGPVAGRAPTIAASPAPLAAAGAPADEALRLRAENARLVATVADLEWTLASRPAVEGAKTRGPRFTFGEMGRLDAVRDADGPTLATAAKVTSDTIVEVYRKPQAGEPVPRDLLAHLQEHVEQMRKYEYRTLDRMPTAAQHNGELTHPISATNLLAGVLEQGGQPLTPSQAAEFERLGLAFEEEFARVRAAWTPTTPRARRLVDERRLKGRFMDGLWVALTEARRPRWVDPELRGFASLDLYDPTLMVIHTSPVLVGATAADVRSKLVGVLRGKLGLTAEVVDPRLDAAADAFVGRATRGLAAVPANRVKPYTFVEAMSTGEASAELVEALLRDLDLADGVRKARLEDPAWSVPRLVAP